ncbi:hypothetical protein HK096_008387, partial [Nowakowskiella sp. JEL0078]
MDSNYNTWACEMCTFVNKPLSLQCEICNRTRCIISTEITLDDPELSKAIEESLHFVKSTQKFPVNSQNENTSLSKNLNENDIDVELFQAIQLSHQKSQKQEDKHQDLISGSSNNNTQQDIILNNDYSKKRRITNFASKRLPSETLIFKNKRTRLDQPSINFYPPYFQGQVKLTYVRGFQRSSYVTIDELIDKVNFQKGILTSFQIDDQWLIEKLPGDKPICIARHGTKNDKRVANTLLKPAYGEKSVHVIPTLGEGSFTCMHAKLM